MSVKMSLRSAITALVEIALPRFSDDKTVLVMTIDVRIRKHGDAFANRHQYVHLMFQRPNNYTKVMWSLVNEPANHCRIKEWKVESDHDSCWKTDGLDTPFFNLVRDMINEIDSDCPWSAFYIDISFSPFEEPHLEKLEAYNYDREKRTFTVTYAKKG